MTRRRPYLIPHLIPLLALLAACAGDPPRIPATAAQAAPRDVVVRLNAAQRLNVDAAGRPLALVVRVYALRQRTAFDQAPYAAFLTPEGERGALGDDLVAVSEVTLVPGQRTPLTLQLGRDGGYLGVVALFHAPAPGGWRTSLPAADVPATGVDVALQACALQRGPLTNGALVRCQ